MKRFLTYTLLTTILTITISCGALSSKQINNKTGYFPANTDRKVTVMRLKSLSADSLKTLLVVSGGDDWVNTAKKMNYFNEVISYTDFEKQLKEKDIFTKVVTKGDTLNLHKAYKLYRPFTYLQVDKSGSYETKNLTAIMGLYHPGIEKFVYVGSVPVNIMYDGWTDHGTVYPLFNSLLDYLRAQK